MRALDARYARRTLPDPFAGNRQWRAGLWWRRRLAGGREAEGGPPRQTYSGLASYGVTCGFPLPVRYWG
ncbi:hypothetical protein ACFV2H_02945 [Streptomyces sp. NPDC059629]|uniref:hypothetical protein n=1 Tax=Streptomyces sp. NPDC059629 TaxID=3346889 RepID=UPI0036C7938D